MGIAFVQKIGQGQHDGTTSWTITPASNVAAHDSIILVIEGEPANTAPHWAPSVTDSAGNTYTVKSNYIQSPVNLGVAFAYCLDALALTTSQTITVSCDGSTTGAQISAAQALEFSGLATTGQPDANPTWANGANNTSVSSSTTTSNAADLLIGAIGVRDNNSLTWSSTDSFTDEGSPGNAASNGEYVDGSYKIVSSTGTYSVTGSWTGGTSSGEWMAGVLALKGAGGGGTVNGSATATGEGGILGGLAGSGNAFTGLSGSAGLGEGLAGVGALGGGLAGVGNVNASSAATPSETFTGSGALGAGLAGSGALASGVAGSGGLGGGLAGSGAVGGGMAGNGSLIAQSTALASALFQGMGALAGNFLAGVGNLTASGSLGGAIHGAATFLGMGALLEGFGGWGGVQPSGAATPGVTLKGSGALGGGVAGSGAVNASSAGSTPATFQGAGALGTGQAGSGSLSPAGAATPGITFQGAGALLAGLFAGSGLVPAPSGSIAGQIVGVFRWLFTLSQNLLQQAFVTKQQTLVFGGTQFLLFTFLREPDMQVQPNSTIQVVMTAKKYDGTLQSGLVTVTCTVTFPDGTTSNYSLSSGIQNTGNGTYTLTYTTKMVGENIENWVGTDAAGNTSNYQNITPVSY